MSDYERIAQAIAFLVSRVDSQPSLQEVAAHLHLSPFHFQRLFCRWAGVTPKRFLQVLTVERAKALLSASRPVLDVSYTLGLSSASRLHDHFVQLEAMTPGEYKAGGAGLTMEYAVHDTPFGQAFIASTAKGVCTLVFLEDGDMDPHVASLAKKWPRAILRENGRATEALVKALFGVDKPLDRPLSLYVSGTNFQISVWRALLQIPPASVTSYSRLAAALGRPRAARAVGRAVGSNPVAVLIPCHRVIQESGTLGGYHWGITRKHALHAWEAARQEI